MMDNEEIEDFFKTMPSFKEKEEEEYEVEFSEHQIADFEECFKKVDKTGTGSVAVSEVGSLLRAAGLNPTLKQIKDISEWFEMNEAERINCQEFILLLKKTWKDSDPQELRKAIEVFDPTGNGYLTVEHFKSTLLNIGETLDEDDFKELLKAIIVQPDGTINTEDIVQILSASFK